MTDENEPPPVETGAEVLAGIINGCPDHGTSSTPWSTCWCDQARRALGDRDRQ